ncbi:unnamed protein product, partial [Iphiclides podalirius]
MLLQRRSLRSRLDLLRGECAVQKRVLDSQQRQVEYAGGVPREFALGDKVWARDFGSNDKWVKGVIEQKEGSRRYILGNGVASATERNKEAEEAEGSDDTPGDTPVVSDAVIRSSHSSTFITTGDPSQANP